MMLDATNRAMVDRAIPHGCRTVCGTCRQPIEEIRRFPYAVIWFHVGGGDGTHEPTPVEPTSPLPREVFTHPAALVDLLADSAEVHGFTVDRSEHTRRTQIAAARMLVQILVPARPLPTCDNCGEAVRITGREPLLRVEHVDGTRSHPAQIGGTR